MVKKRIIPVILLKNGIIVQSRLFSRYQPIGNPIASVERFSNWESDELIYLDISSEGGYDIRRNDLTYSKFETLPKMINLISEKCFMPLTFGGGIRTIEDVEIRLKNGADKITLNTMAIENTEFITEVAKKYGSQAVVVSIDVKETENKNYLVYKGGKEPTSLDPRAFALKCEDFGAGEILLNAIDRDGTKTGFNINLINYVNDQLHIPLIAVGGAGNWEHFEEVLNKTDVSALAAANIFQHSENSVFNCRKYLFEKELNIRPPAELSSLKRNL